MKHSAINDSATVLLFGNTPLFLSLSDVNGLLTTISSALSIGYALYRFINDSKTKKNGRNKEEKR